MPTVLQSHTSGGASSGSISDFPNLTKVSKLMASCPYVEVILGGVKVPCLVDTGSMVTTVTESFFFAAF